MSKDNQLFIKVFDQTTAQLLINSGFQIVSKEPNQWTFLNDIGKLNFDEIDLKKMHFCSNLSI